MISPRLDELFSTVYDDLEQTIPAAYQSALRHAKSFQEEIAKVARMLDQSEQNWSCRPGSGVKDAHRILEKAAKFGVGVPRDLLGAKFVVSSLRSAYELANALIEQQTLLEFVGFNDRFVDPQPSGYRDLQFEALFKGLVVEIKICHALMDEVDDIEHKIYEIVRALQTRGDRLTSSERMVLEQLTKTFKRLYTDAWNEIPRQERSGL